MSSSRLMVSWEGLHGIHRTILSKHLSICIRHLFGKGRHELGVGGHELGLDGLRRCKVCGGGADGCSNSLGDCQLFGRGLPTVVGEASFNLCGDHHELVIRLQRIYNFLLFHAVILSFFDVLQSFYSNFISFFGTNLLT